MMTRSKFVIQTIFSVVLALVGIAFALCQAYAACTTPTGYERHVHEGHDHITSVSTGLVCNDGNEPAPGSYMVIDNKVTIAGHEEHNSWWGNRINHTGDCTTTRWRNGGCFVPNYTHSSYCQAVQNIISDQNDYRCEMYGGLWRCMEVLPVTSHTTWVPGWTPCSGE